MINAVELRLGNYVLYKAVGRISMVPMNYFHFEALGKGDAINFFPVVLKPELLEKCGFIENKDYPLLPQAREFKLVLPIQGSQQNEMMGYVKSNGECFVRAVVNHAVISQNLFNLHSIQNLFFVLTGAELDLKK